VTLTDKAGKKFKEFLGRKEGGIRIFTTAGG
jgi:Fe-S cluster assembly iron-binding protein IscA